MHILRNPIPRYLETWINTGNYIKTLGELDITNVSSDGDLFSKIADIYHENGAGYGSLHCNIPKRFGRVSKNQKFQWHFQKPTSAVFRKISLFSSPESCELLLIAPILSRRSHPQSTSRARSLTSLRYILPKILIQALSTKSKENSNPRPSLLPPLFPA